MNQPRPATPEGQTHEHTHVYVLIDRSGSMATIAADVIGGFNQFLADQQRDGADAKITLVQFDSQDPQHVIMANAPVREAVPLDGHTYRPRGGTPLLDATGLLIGRARVEAAARVANGLPREAVVFVTVTDGEENESSEYDLARIRALIAECEADGWTFVYLSAALHAYEDAGAMGVRAGATQAFAADPRGAQSAFVDLSSKLMTFRAKKRRHLAAELDDFWDGDKAAERDMRQRGDDE